MTESQRVQLINRILDENKSESDFKKFICEWFYLINEKGQKIQVKELDFHLLKRENIKEWLAWAFFTETLESLCEKNILLIEEIIKKIELDKAIKIEEGYNNSVHSNHLNFSPVEAWNKPFIVYFALNCCEIGGYVIYYFLGFKKCSKKLNNNTKFSYFYRPVHFPGIGVGVFVYCSFFRNIIRKDDDRPIFIVELPHVSHQLVSAAEIPNIEETVKLVELMLKANNYHDAIFIGHSLGSVYSSWMNKYSSLRCTLILIDPVCFQLYSPDLIFNFLHRPFSNAPQFLLRWISRELYISHFINRHFAWHLNVMFPENLPTGSRVYISLKDSLINAPKVWEYLSSHGINGKAYANLDHASFLFDKEAFQEIVDGIVAVSNSFDVIKSD
ncbi:hypothetical protein HK099_008736 [Clydaea vesicula]|uniref:AB hydrolase-1 domain-containing protein n=1 Tax=Clydaea vesicula TaxID=447962 RepID=A0AAD5TV49_9FUNG|nr:hypothetical protein HK099_008736 [Clydaea vesicula]